MFCKYFFGIFRIFPPLLSVAICAEMWYHLGMDKEAREAKKQEKKARREEKQRERAARHIAVCPHCGKNVLDHMTECPHCKGALVPAGYRPVDPAKYKKIKLGCTIAGVLLSIALVLVIVLTR